ncbi:ABA4-like family protein [Parvularcula marina]|uniref:DUF4281 domain-containing protein n=1 Tax=Parvularcula marina TaxID=2292771 RepID=A0A371RHT7_9PROT|nr:ABA4-like family protein [Parvularcula marina]RFB05003.1 DUF4281 domain-containing protein [Parvularcula marina]
MTPDLLFSIGNMGVLAGWLPLAFLPFWRGTQIIAAVLIPLLLAVAYVTLLFVPLGEPSTAPLDFTSLAGVKAMFANDQVMLVGWFHYLAFDLFVGAWEVRDSRTHGIPHLLVVPCLILTFMFGPAGFLLYMIIRTIRLRSVALGN